MKPIRGPGSNFTARIANLSDPIRGLRHEGDSAVMAGMKNIRHIPHIKLLFFSMKTWSAFIMMYVDSSCQLGCHYSWILFITPTTSRARAKPSKWNLPTTLFMQNMLALILVTKMESVYCCKYHRADEIGRVRMKYSKRNYGCGAGRFHRSPTQFTCSFYLPLHQSCQLNNSKVSKFSK